ncbi:MAG: hypothetical protein K1X77_02540 [Bacteroidia bacterium]|nr:hypothetical protein [Bacteroidia bacterium]
MYKKLRYFITLGVLLLMPMAVGACPVCEKQQPAITKGLTHGAGPESNWDWVIISVITLITILTFVFSLKYLIKPGEKGNNHIKHLIINNE